jgi:hypothetical protein
MRIPSTTPGVTITVLLACVAATGSARADDTRVACPAGTLGLPVQVNGASKDDVVTLPIAGQRVRVRLPIEAGAAVAKDMDAGGATLKLQLNDPSHQLRLFDPKQQASGSTIALELRPQEVRVIEVQSDTFDETKLGEQRASLVISGACMPRLYALRIESSYPSLGLRAAAWAPEIHDITVRKHPHKTVFTQCFDTDRKPDPHLLRVEFQAVYSAGADAIQLDSETLHAYFDGRADCPHGLYLETVPLRAGLYVASLKINDQQLAVQLRARLPWGVVVLLVLVAGLISLLLRGMAAHARRRRENGDRIEQAARAVRGRRTPFVWDDLRCWNELRRALAHNHSWTLSEVAKIVEQAEAQPTARVYAQTQAALIDDPIALPLEVRDRLMREWRALGRASSLELAAQIDKRLSWLEAKAADAFVEPLRKWLGELREDLEKLRPPSLAAPNADRDLRRAWDALERLVEDALEILSETSTQKLLLEQGHVALLDRVRPTALELVKRANGVASTIDLEAVAFADLDGYACPPGLRSVVGERIGCRIVPQEDKLRAGEDVTLKAVLDVPRELGKHELRYDWRIDPKPHSLRRWRSVDGINLQAAEELTLVFADRGDVQVTLVVYDYLTNRLLGFCQQPFKVGAVGSSANVLRVIDWITSQALAVVAVFVSAIAALAFLWSGKTFGGSAADIISAAALGLGVDVGIGAGPQLIRSVVSALRGGKEAL